MPQAIPASCSASSSTAPRRWCSMTQARRQKSWTASWDRPALYFVFAVPQDSITAPADFNASASGYIKTIWNGTATGTGAGTMTFDATTGFYTITLTGVTVPDNATMLTGGVGYTYSLGSARRSLRSTCRLPVRRLHSHQGLHCRPEVRRSCSGRLPTSRRWRPMRPAARPTPPDA